jgi:hypothetical protein
VQNDASLGKLLSGHSKAEVKALANADKLLGKLLSGTSTAEAKGDATKKAEEELNQEAAAGKTAGSWLQTQLVDH